MYKKTTLLALCAVFTLSSCTTLTLPINEMVRVPKWIFTLPEVKTETGAYGVGIAKAGDSPGLQRRIAQAQGRSQIVERTRTQIANNLQKEEVRKRILELSDNNPKISREDIVAAIDVIVRNIQGARTVVNLTEGTIYGARSLTGYYAPGGTFYLLMGITNPESIRKSVEEMIQGAMDGDLLGLRCQQVEKCLNISKLLSTAIDGDPTIDSDSR